jgi:hypothetical protein
VREKAFRRTASLSLPDTWQRSCARSVDPHRHLFIVGARDPRNVTPLLEIHIEHFRRLRLRVVVTGFRSEAEVGKSVLPVADDPGHLAAPDVEQERRLCPRACPSSSPFFLPRAL